MKGSTCAKIDDRCLNSHELSSDWSNPLAVVIPWFVFPRSCQSPSTITSVCDLDHSPMFIGGLQSLHFTQEVEQ